MRYGKQLSITSDGMITSVTERNVVNWSEVRKREVYNETVHVRDEKEALAEFLKLLDRKKAGEVKDIGVLTISDEDGRIKRVEKTWIVEDLH